MFRLTRTVFAIITVLMLSSAVNASGPNEVFTCGAGLTCIGDIASLDDMRAYPQPQVTPLTYDNKLLHDRTYQQVSGKLDIHDGPNGTYLSSIDAGFNFLTTLNTQDGWTEISQGKWVRSNVLTHTNSIISRFTGVLLPDASLPYTMAWLLVNLYPASRPGGNPDETTNRLMHRYTRVNIYNTVDLDGWRWYQVGPTAWVHQTQVAKSMPVARPADVTTEQWISIDLYEQTLVAYEDDKPIFTTLIASGLPRWPTNEGTFHIYWRRMREDMSWGKPGDDFYYLEEVPWTMFFDEGRALHGAYWHDGFGYRRSHGCVNMSITDAHWLYHWVADIMGSRASADLEEGPQVYIHSSGTYSTG